jgi:KaiC/GvpD/RAD55 family RecA-like ATPase
MFKPELLAPWLLDQRARLSKTSALVLALVIYATGINPPSITRSLHTFSDVVLEMRTDETKEEPERQFRVLKARDVSHSAKWVSFKITDSGVDFANP